MRLQYVLIFFFSKKITKNDAKNSTDSLNLEISSIGLMINYKNGPVIYSKNNNGDTFLAQNINSKPPRPRLITTNVINKNGPILEIKGQNVVTNNHKRHNSISSEPGHVENVTDDAVVKTLNQKN